MTVEIARGSYSSLELIGTIFKNMKKGKLQLTVYQLNNKDLARQKAIKMKSYLLEKYPEINKKDVGISWFSSPEILKTVKGKKKINESVNFLLPPNLL